MSGKTMWLLFVEAWKSNVAEHAESVAQDTAQRKLKAVDFTITKPKSNSQPHFLLTV